MEIKHGMKCRIAAVCWFCILACSSNAQSDAGRVAPKPLFRDPVHDGAADPVLIWNRREQKWFMFYTNRRANLTNSVGVAWVHGTAIGIAESADGGARWKYRGTAAISLGGTNDTLWAPDVVEHEGVYHMFVTHVPGVFTNWQAGRTIVHLTSPDLLKWKPEGALKLASDRVIDASVCRLPDGKWRMWYNNERDKKSIYYADSPDLYQWTDQGKAVGDRAGEGPKVFRWKNQNWMVVDNWHGLGVYRSDDLRDWTRQPGNLLEQPGRGPDDQAMGGHPDVVVNGDRAFLFYFTHPGRVGAAAHQDGLEQRRSSIQVVELQFKNGMITCDRDQPTRVQLNPEPPPVPRRVVFSTETKEVKWSLAELGPNLPTDWSGLGALTLEMRCSSAQRFSLQLFTAAGVRKIRVHPWPKAWLRVVIPLRYLERGDHGGNDLAALGNKANVGYWLNLSGPYGPLKSVEALGLTMEGALGDATVELRTVRVEKEPTPGAVLEPKPLVDEFGQWIDADWPGKAQSLEQLDAAWSAEAQALAEGDFGWSGYGGFTNVQVKGTGFFRVENLADRWWLVDPDGFLFFSTGVNGISPFIGTPVAEGSEDLFAKLPPSNLGAALRRPGRGLEVSFHTWNLVRRYESAWRGVWLDSTLARMDAWGFNTIGNWSDSRLGDMQRKPYVVMLRGWGNDDGSFGMPDVFADDFPAKAAKVAEEQCAPHQDDPWLLGYFVANEPPWPGREQDIAAAYLNQPGSGMCRELKKYLAGNDTPERRREFVHLAVAKFLETANAAIRRSDSNHLNLGVRFGSRPSEAMLRAARACDVFSMNSYAYEPDPEAITLAARITGRPILIGEFHFGVPGRGLAPGLRQTVNQQERGIAYRHYVESAAAHPAVVGTHWFQWVDEPNTGRFDGENYNIGLVDVTDRPYTELIDAAKLTHRRLFQVHSGTLPPLEQKALVR